MIKDIDLNTIDDAVIIADIKRALSKNAETVPDVESELLLFHNHHKQNKSSRKYITYYTICAIAACFAILVTLVFYEKLGNNTHNELQVFTANQDATNLTIKSSGELIQATASVDKSLHLSCLDIDKSYIRVYSNNRPIGDSTVVNTPAGKLYNVTLPDGTKIMLNAQSRLIIPDSFNKNNRMIYLYGEAFFEIFHDPKHPFVVKTQNLSVTAIGTAFNVRSYLGSPTNVALAEGRITVSNGNQPPVNVNPGEQTILDKDGKIEKSTVDINEIREWQNGLFYFDDVQLSDIMCELGRWYNVSVRFADKKRMNEKLHFVAYRTVSLQENLKNFNDIGIQTDFTDGVVIVR